MPSPTKSLLSLPSGTIIFDPGILRPGATVRWSGESGNVDLRFQWDSDSSFAGSVSEVVHVDMGGATGGSFTLTFNGQTTAAILFSANAAAVKAALELLTGVHVVTVTGTGTAGDPFVITHTDPINSERNVPDMTGTDSLTGGTGLVVTVNTQGSEGPPFGTVALDDATNLRTEAPSGDLGLSGPWYWRVAVVDRSDGLGGWSSAQEIQYVDPIEFDRFLHLLGNVGVGFDYAEDRELSDAPSQRYLVWNDATSGTFTLTHNSNTTSSINYDAAAADVKSALETLASIDLVRVRKIILGSGVRGFDVEFLDPGHTAQTLTGSGGGLSGGSLSIDELQEGGEWGAAIGGTEGGDGDAIEGDRFVHLLGNVGVGFHPTDEPIAGWGTGIGGTEGPDGNTWEDFDRFLHLLANLTTDQPCPFIFNLSTGVADAGDGIQIFGQGFGNNSSPNYGAVARLYESPDFGAPFVVLPTVSIVNGSTLDVLTVTIPPGSENGYVAVVHTITPVCPGSNFKFLQVNPENLDPEAGWWIEAWSEDGTTKLIDHVEAVAASFQPILNGVGGGWIDLPADYERIAEICDPDPRDGNGDPLPPVTSLLRVYLHGVLQYSFFAQFRDTILKEKSDSLVRISGDGIESSLTWGSVRPANYQNTSVLLDHVYGSADNLIQNGNADQSRDLFTNGGLEDGDSDPWEATGTATIQAVNTTARSGGWSLQIDANADDDGARQGLGVQPGQRIYVDSYVREDAGTGDDVTAFLYYMDADDNEVVLDSQVVALAAIWKIAQLDAVIPADINEVFFEWRYTDATGTPHIFYADDSIGFSSVDPWIPKGSATVTLTDDFVGDGRFAFRVNPAVLGDGMRQSFRAQPGQRTSLAVGVSGTAGDSIRLRAVIGGVAQTDTVVLTGTPSFDILSVSGTPSPDESTLLIEIFTLDASSPADFYVDVASAVGGEDATSGGGIFGDLIDLAKARGVLGPHTYDFTDSADSKGESWDEPSIATKIRKSLSLLDVARQLASYGMDWKVTNGYVIQLFNELGADYTSLPDCPTIVNGKAVTGGKVSRQIPRATRIFAEGANSIWTEKNNPSDELGILPRESYLAASSALDATALDRAASHALDNENARQSAIRIDLAPESGVLPFFDFGIGDVIFVDLYDEDGAPVVTKTQYPEGFRVLAISANLSEEEPHYTVDLNWMVLEAQAAEAATLRLLQESQRIGTTSPGGINSGDSIGGGTLIFPSLQDHSHDIDDIDGLTSLPPSGPAGGDLAGQYPNPSVAGLRGIPFGTGAPDDGDVPRYDSGLQRIVWADPAVAPGGLTWSDLLSDAKGSTDTPDDLFPGTSLDGKWTVVAGSAGTLTTAFFNADANRNVYEVDDGRLLVQVGNADEVSLRQDYTLPDGNSIIAAIEVPYPGSSGDNSRVTLSLNDNDTGPGSGNAIHATIEQDTGEWVFQGLSGAFATTGGVEIATGRAIVSELVYLRITRTGLLYRTWGSINRGRSWTMLGSLTPGGAFNNVWLNFLGDALGTNEPNPIYTVYWVQQGSNDLDPW